jgi:hypothetical protein
VAEKRLTWLDTTSGHHLTLALPFYKDDEAWRCNKHGHGPLLTRVGSPTAEPLLNASLPASTSELMRKVLGGAGVALEDVHIAGQSTYLFVSLFIVFFCVSSFSFYFCRSIRCLNRAMEKIVHVRYTTNAWSSFQEARASFVPDDNNIADRFVAEIPNCEDALLEFAIRYEVDGCTYWDNNCGANYKLQVRNKSCTSPSSARRARPILRKQNLLEV